MAEQYRDDTAPLKEGTTLVITGLSNAKIII